MNRLYEKKNVFVTESWVVKYFHESARCWIEYPKEDET